jgi:hypothetical protein
VDSRVWRSLGLRAECGNRVLDFPLLAGRDGARGGDGHFDFARLHWWDLEHRKGCEGGRGARVREGRAHLREHAECTVGRAIGHYRGWSRVRGMIGRGCAVWVGDDADLGVEAEFGVVADGRSVELGSLTSG